MHPTAMIARVACVAAAMTLCSAGRADDETPTSQELLDRLAAAEARINELEAQNSDNWLTEERAEAIRGLVQDVLADADTRTSLMQSGLTAGYQDGFVISSADGNWLLRTNMLLQERFVYNTQNQGGGPPIDEQQWGFENPRTKFIMSGHVVNPSFFFRVDINLGTGNTGTAGNLPGGTYTGLENAYLGYDYGNGLRFVVGQYKVPMLREWMVEDQFQLGVERSVWGYQFNGGYTQGLMVQFEQDTWRLWGSYNDGIYNANTVAVGGGVTTPPATELALTGRAEYKLSGTWDQFEQLTSPRGGEQGMLVGAALHWQKGAFGTAGATQQEIWLATIDGQFEFGGWNIYAAASYANVRPPSGSPGPASNVWGAMIQGGCYIADDWELYGRYAWTTYDRAPAQDMNLVTVGVNKYFADQNVKWSTDIGYGINAVGGPVAGSTVPGGLGGAPQPAPVTDFRADNPGERGQVVIRTQFQLFF